ncbi:MAG: efflux RND transporter periplasmic adaptor subunit [Gammaproteobacteria bacterium]|nr:efflux RND transporter periplasmic adaptor subunit [Gammaproteobacteria bacterium]
MRLITLCLVGLSLLACNQQTPTANNKPEKPHLVEVITAQTKTISIQRQRSGTLTALRKIQIYNQEEGQITALPFYEGDKVTKGDIVAKLDDRLLQAQLARAQATVRKAEKDLLSIKGLSERKLIPQTEITRVETELAVAKADQQALLTRIDYTVMRAPVSGLISERFSEQGNIAERYTHLMTISDQSALITKLDVSELLINKLNVGDKVSMTIDALTELEPLSATISRIFPTLDPITRTGTVEITLNPVPHGAKPGQLARVILRTQEQARLLIPFAALRRSGDGDYVFIVDAQQHAQIRPVVTGLKIGDAIEILDGIKDGEQVITRGYTNLNKDKAVTVVTPFSKQTASQL